MLGRIYKHTNITTGRVYIGQTTQEVSKRWGKDGTNYKTNKMFYRDILKYGWDGFTHEVIEVVEAKTIINLKEKLNKTENYYICKCNSMLSDYGYNTAVSTDFASLKLSQAAKRYMSIRMSEGVTLAKAHTMYREIKRTKKRRKKKLRRGGK